MARTVTPYSVSRSCCEKERGTEKRKKRERERRYWFPGVSTLPCWCQGTSRSVLFWVWTPAPSGTHRKASDESQLPGPGEKGGSGPWCAPPRKLPPWWDSLPIFSVHFSLCWERAKQNNVLIKSRAEGRPQRKGCSAAHTPNAKRKKKCLETQSKIHGNQ